MTIKMVKGNEIMQENSKFVAYTKEVSSREAIREAYLKLRLIHSRSTAYCVCIQLEMEGTTVA